MTINSTFDILQTIKTFATGARSAKVMSARQCKRDTIEDARKKTADKLIANRDYFKDGTLDRPDLVYKKQSDNTYVLGVKYGNRYLSNIVQQHSFIEGIDESCVGQVLDALAEAVTNGHYDRSIEQIMQANIEARNKP